MMQCSVCQKEISLLSRGKAFGMTVMRSAKKHHVRPIKYGGTNKKENIEYLCSRCHGKIHGIYQTMAIEIALKKDKRFFEGCFARLKKGVEA